MTEERRSAERVECEIWVEESHDRETYFQRAVNLSAGGLFFDRTIPHPNGTVVNLRFELPGADGPAQSSIEVKGEIVNTPEGGGLGMGVRFVDLPAEARARIEKFVAG